MSHMRQLAPVAAWCRRVE